ncbi:MAG: 3-deoxy-7-phosphoheptulonate synthase [Halanaerobium sp.]|nr:3-deoxy-7-phosphoheptulonate synthase [Halanaerobium sp.]
MVIVLEEKLNQTGYEEIVGFLKREGINFQEIEGKRVLHLTVAREKEDLLSALKSFPQVMTVLRTGQDYQLVKTPQTPLEAAGITWGGRKIPIIAGPCALEDEGQFIALAKRLQELGVQAIRGALYKPRTSPYSYQGIGAKGTATLNRARDLGLVVVSEVMDNAQLNVLYPVADILQVGSRNMKNYSLLKELGRQDKPVLLKRGLSATYREFLLAAEYLLAEGNQRVILCERGIRTFETHTRNTLDITAVPVLKELAGLPVIVDPSHGTGNWRYVPPMAMAAVAAGTDGLMLEVHPDPARALSDGCQSLTVDRFSSLLKKLQRVARAVDREIDGESEVTGYARD